MVIMMAKYVTRPNDTAQILEKLEEMAREVTAKELRCLMYRVHQTQEHPEELLLYEVYQDEDSLNAHRQTPHFARIIDTEIVPRLISRERSFLTLIADVSR